MKIPIPRPKNITFSEKYLPAAFTAKEVDPEFAPALRVFASYVRRVFGEAVQGEGELCLMKEQGLGEGYRISIGEEIRLIASNNVGMNSAFATLLQLAEMQEDRVMYPVCEISDAPDNTWRGVMLDLVRCYHEIAYLYAVADLCWFYKLNRFQLHLTDDQGVRFPFAAFPKAVSEEHYSKEQLVGLVDYCKERGITLVPELDAPGHFRAFNIAYPELFMVTAPQDSASARAPSIMRLQEPVFEGIQKMYAELIEVFSDSPWIHIGGDEADIAKWKECNISEDYRKSNGLMDAQELYGHCVAKLAQMILDMGRTPMVWEGFSEKCNDMIPKETVVFVWESMYQVAPSLLAAGFEIINASWQPLYIVSPERMWAPKEILEWDKNVWKNWYEKSAAHEAPIVVPRESAVLGGQICAWGDKMQPKYAYAPRQQMLRDEFLNLCERVSALSQKVWTSFAAPDSVAFWEDAEKLQSVLFKTLKP